LKRTELASPLKPRIAVIANPYSSMRYDVANQPIARFFIFHEFAANERQDSPKALFGGVKSTAQKCARVAPNIHAVVGWQEVATMR
jgi:hypothetical protein